MTDILALGAHPDDIEFACGGILAKEASKGKSIVLVDLSLGDKGTNGAKEQRREESLMAANVIGAKREFLDFADCEIFDTYSGRLELVKIIRKYKPRLVIAPLGSGWENHPDHIETGKMTRAACRLARFSAVLKELPIHWVDGILHYPSLAKDSIDFLVDISDYVKVWTEMMRCHASQMRTFDYVDWNLRFASNLGMLMGVSYAQGLIKENPIIIEDLLNVSKGTREL